MTFRQTPTPGMIFWQIPTPGMTFWQIPTPGMTFWQIPTYGMTFLQIPITGMAFQNFIVEPCIDTISINSNQLMHISVFIKNTLKTFNVFLINTEMCMSWLLLMLCNFDFSLMLKRIIWHFNYLTLKAGCLIFINF